MNNELDAETEKAAVNMIRSGFAPETVVQMIYAMGHYAGMLDMAETSQKVAANLREAA